MNVYTIAEKLQLTFAKNLMTNFLSLSDVKLSASYSDSST